MKELNINIKRLANNLEELAKIGANKTGGIDRSLGDETDLSARRWLTSYWKKKLGIAVRIDAIANLWVRREGDEKLPPIVIGSHHDAVANGGKYDGALGVLVATEIVQTLCENNIDTRHPIEIVSFTGEEPNPFNVSTLGSKVLSGRLKKSDLIKLKSYKDGTSLEACIKKLGGDITKADTALIKPNDIRAFIECHIEQGRRLYDKNKNTAVVSCITGIYRENVTVIGEANHAGTTLMRARKDAFVATSELNIAFERILSDMKSDDIVGTISYVKVLPNAVGIVPGEVELVIEIRTCKSELREGVLELLSVEVAKIEEQRGVKIIRSLNLDQKEMPMDKEVMSAINRGILLEGEPEIELVSMAGHDAANMQRVTKSGMIFVQSIDGKSHCPQEATDIVPIEVTANAMLKAVMILDKEMD